MTKIPYGGAGEIPPVEVKCKADEFENEYMNKGTTPDYYIRPSYVGEVIV